MVTKKELLESIILNPTYQEAVLKLSPEEKKKVEAILFGDFLNAMHKLQTQFASIVKNPDVAKQMSEVLNSNSDVYNIDASGEEHVGRKPE